MLAFKVCFVVAGTLTDTAAVFIYLVYIFTRASQLQSFEVLCWPVCTETIRHSSHPPKEYLFPVTFDRTLHATDQYS